MTPTSFTVEAFFDQGVLRPVQPLPLAQDQRVTITVRLAEEVPDWPTEVAAIYQEMAEEDRRLAESMLPGVRETWPAREE